MKYNIADRIVIVHRQIRNGHRVAEEPRDYKPDKRRERQQAWSNEDQFPRNVEGEGFTGRFISLKKMHF